eukprot:403344610
MDYPYFQISLLLYQSLLLYIYVGIVKPFETVKFNRIEQFNEVCILAVSYHLLIFTDYVDDTDIQDDFGYSIIAITMVNIVVNMGIMIVETIKKLRISFPAFIQKLKNLKARIKNRKYNESLSSKNIDKTEQLQHFSKMDIKFVNQTVDLNDTNNQFLEQNQGIQSKLNEEDQSLNGNLKVKLNDQNWSNKYSTFKQQNGKFQSQKNFNPTIPSPMSINSMNYQEPLTFHQNRLSPHKFQPFGDFINYKNQTQNSHTDLQQTSQYSAQDTIAGQSHKSHSNIFSLMKSEIQSQSYNQKTVQDYYNNSHEIGQQQMNFMQQIQNKTKNMIKNRQLQNQNVVSNNLLQTSDSAASESQTQNNSQKQQNKTPHSNQQEKDDDSDEQISYDSDEIKSSEYSKTQNSQQSSNLTSVQNSNTNEDLQISKMIYLNSNQLQPQENDLNSKILQLVARKRFGHK